jgi:hypothetical protein
MAIETTGIKALIDAGLVSAPPARANTAASMREFLKDFVDLIASETSPQLLRFRGAWQASTIYTAGDGVTNGGNTYRRKADGISGVTFDSDNWDILVSGGSVADDSLDTVKYKSNSITPEKASFLALGKNLFDQSAGTDGFFLDGSGNPTVNATYGYSAYIKVTTGLTYTVADAVGFVRKVSYYNASKVFVSDVDTNGTSTKTLTIPATVAYMRITYYIARKATTQLELGSSQTAFSAYGFFATGIAVPPAVVPQDASNRFATDAEKSLWNSKFGSDAIVAEGSKNLFNLATGTDSFYLDGGGNPTANVTYGYSDYIAVTAGLTYTGSDGTNPTKRINYYNGSKTHINQVADPGATVTIPAGAAFVRLTYFVSGKAAFQFELGGSHTSYVAYIAPILKSVAGALVKPLASDLTQDTTHRFATDAEKVLWNAKLDPSAVVSALGKNLFNTGNAKDSFYLSAGTETANAAYGYGQDFIPVTPGQTYTAWGGTQGARFVTYYDAGKVYHSQLSSTTKTFTIPSGVAFMRCTYFVGEKLTFQVELNSTNTGFEAYKVSLKSVNGAVVPDVVTQPANLVLPSKLYAVVGKEFNLYYDACTLLPEYGAGTPNFLFDIVCSKGAMGYRSFRFTPTSGDVGTYALTFNILNNQGVIVESAVSTLVVVAAANPGSVKHFLDCGDSTVDEGTTTATLQANLAAIGGNIPIFHGQHQASPGKNEARTGRTYGTFAGIAGTIAYKFYVSGVSPSLDLSNIRNTYYYHNTSGNQVLLSERWKIEPDGTGWIIGYYFGSFTIPVSFPTTLVASVAPGFPSTITVTNAETLNGFSIFKDSDGMGALNISFYRQTRTGDGVRYEI